MSAAWTHPIHAAATARARALADHLPCLVTGRLTLRAPRLSDWPLLEEIWTGPRSDHIGGPFTDEEAWLDFNQCVAGWLLRGFGPLTITDTDTGCVLGLAVWGHELGDPEPELGWLLTAAAEGQGYATEAARAVLAFAQSEGARPVSYIATGNDRSVRVAARLGGVASDPHPLDATVSTWRYPAEAPT